MSCTITHRAGVPPPRGACLHAGIRCSSRLRRWAVEGCCNWWTKERRERWRRVRGADGRQQWIKAADLRPKEGGQLSLVVRPSVQTRISRSSALKVSKQCLQVVGWLLMHRHRRLL